MGRLQNEDWNINFSTISFRDIVLLCVQKYHSHIFIFDYRILTTILCYRYPLVISINSKG